MEKAKECLRQTQQQSEAVSGLCSPPPPFRPGIDPSFYEYFILRGIRVDRVEPGFITCTFKVPSRLTVRISIQNLVSSLSICFRWNDPDYCVFDIKLLFKFIEKSWVLFSTSNWLGFPIVVSVWGLWLSACLISNS